MSVTLLYFMPDYCDEVLTLRGRRTPAVTQDFLSLVATVGPERRTDEQGSVNPPRSTRSHLTQDFDEMMPFKSVWYGDKESRRLRSALRAGGSWLHLYNLAPQRSAVSGKSGSGQRRRSTEH